MFLRYILGIFWEYLCSGIPGIYRARDTKTIQMMNTMSLFESYLMLIMGISQVSIRHFSGIYWVYIKHIIEISQTLLRYSSGIFRVSLRYIISQAFIRHILGLTHKSKCCHNRSNLGISAVLEILQSCNLI